jgi:hypothetical protein
VFNVENAPHRAEPHRTAPNRTAPQNAPQTTPKRQTAPNRAKTRRCVCFSTPASCCNNGLLGNEQDSTWIFSKNEKQRHKPRRAHTNRDAPTQTKRNGYDFPHLPAKTIGAGANLWMRWHGQATSEGF